MRTQRLDHQDLGRNPCRRFDDREILRPHTGQQRPFPCRDRNGEAAQADFPSPDLDRQEVHRRAADEPPTNFVLG
jgi:hypothetical protein